MEAISLKFRVSCCPATAYDTFVAHFDEWWPKHSHSVSAGVDETPTEIRFTARDQAAIVEVAANGDEHLWGTVLGVQPRQKLAIAWHPGRPANEATLLEIVFGLETDGSTSVAVIQSGWDRLGADAAELRDAYANDWGFILGHAFTSACAKAAEIKRPAPKVIERPRAGFFAPLRQALHLN